MTHTHDDHRGCLALAERLSEYIDDELPDDLRRQIASHLDDCADCERFVESLRRVRGLGQLLRKPSLAPERLAELSELARRALGPD